MSSFFVITKEKEGFDVPESEIPIDIHYNKFLDWLVDRKKVPSDWNKELQKLEKEIVYAKSLVANNEKISQMINGELWIGKVEEIVKEIEKTEKGWTGSAEGNSWRRVLKHLKWKYLFLAHSARLLVSLMTYEIPALRKEGDTFQKQINDAEKKIADFTKSASELKNQHERECKKLGIKGENIEEELNELTNELPEFYKSTAKLASGEGIQQAIDLYKKFIENMHRSFEDEEINSKIDLILSNICPLLSYVHKYGDDYIEIMEKRKRGETITENDYSIYEQLKNKKNVKEEEINIQPTINWDISDDTQVTELNFDIGESNEVHDIQWDITDETGDKEVAIQWDISVEDSGDKQASIQWDIGNEDDIVNNANNDPSERSLDTILGTTSTRNQFKDDLLELQAFLKQRLVEMENDKGSLVIQLGVQQQLGEANAAVVLPLLKLIDSILDSFNNERFRLLTDIKTSKRYTERLANSLKQKLDLAQRATSSANQYQNKVQQLITTSSSIYPKINTLSEEVKLIKKHTESELSKLYSNRPVNII